MTLLAGGAYFHHADSFAMMRGGHLDFCVLGAFQVSTTGDLANWHTGEPDAIPAVGGAMDLAIGAKKVFVMMEHQTRGGESKIVARCTYPLTSIACVDRIYTDLAVIDVTPLGLRVVEMVDGMALPELADPTGAARDGLSGRDPSARIARRRQRRRTTRKPMPNAFICDAIRLRIGRYGGALAHVRTDDLGAIHCALIERNANVDWSAVDDVIYGCANQAGEDNRNVGHGTVVGRASGRCAGTTVNRLCGSRWTPSLAWRARSRAARRH